MRHAGVRPALAAGGRGDVVQCGERAGGQHDQSKKKKKVNNKAKTSRSVTKRFKATATGKLLRRRPFRQHLLTKKHPLRKQKLRKCATPPFPDRHLGRSTSLLQAPLL